MGLERLDLLSGARVLETSCGVAGSYCGKLLVDAGAEVVKVEPEGGDPLRRWTTRDAPVDGRDGALFDYLNASKRSVVGLISSDGAAHLVEGADLIIDDGKLGGSQIERLRGTNSKLTIISITPFGLTGPWCERPATEFTLQAICGSTGSRGPRDGQPTQAGGRLGEWITGAFGAVAALAALRMARALGRGEHIDVSMLECMATTMGGYNAIQAGMGRRLVGPPRIAEIPSIEPTLDGYVGFCTITAQQFSDFCAMIGQPELLDDPAMATYAGRVRKGAELVDLIHRWTTARKTSEILELAARFRIPASVIGTPDTIPDLDHFVERGVFVKNPSGSFAQPRVPYIIESAARRRAAPAPGLDQHAGHQWPARAAATTDPRVCPSLGDIRVIDFTAFWAGPCTTQILATLGADVIKVESIQRPDGMRFSSTRSPGDDAWWEWGPIFQAVNVNKRGVTIDMGTVEGRDLARQLIAAADVVIENFSPRVFEQFGLTWDAVQAVNPRAVLVRMPAFGLDGPWRDRTGFAQTMEQATGMAWLTGFPDGPPVIPRGPCDPIAGLHAAVATLAAIEERDRSGRGQFVEVPMVEAALNVAAESVIERSAYGTLLARDGNRSPGAAPQGVYRCAGEENWLALSVVTDEHWQALRHAMDDPAWAGDRALDSSAGRRLHHDLIDRRLGAWLRNEDVDAIVDSLVALGVPAARVEDPALVASNAQLRARGFVEQVQHPVVGPVDLFGAPFSFGAERSPWIRRPSPTLGEHNEEVFGGLLALDAEQIEALRELRIIGERPVGAGSG